MSGFRKRPQQSADDGYKGSGGWSYTGSQLLNGNGFSGQHYDSGHRYSNATIPKGSIVSSAAMGFTFDDAGFSNGTIKLRIYGIAEDNTDSFTSDPTGRTKTSNYVDWTMEGPFSDGDEASPPGLSAIIQEIIDRPGWESGNAIGILVLERDSDTKIFVGWVSYDQNVNKCAELVVTYIAPSFSPSTSPSVSVSPSLSPSLSPSVSVSPSSSMSPSPPPSDYGLKVKKQSVNKDVESITDPKELVFTSARGVLGLHHLDTVVVQTGVDGNINTTDNHGIGYTPIVVVTAGAYDGNQVILPIEWHSFYVNGSSETIEVTEQFNFKIDGTKIRIIIHAEEYNHDTFVTTNLASREYTFKVYYYFNELVETY